MIQKCEEASAIKAQLEADMRSATPAHCDIETTIEIVKDALECLSRHSIKDAAHEVKRIGNPPRSLQMVAEGMCHMFGTNPGVQSSATLAEKGGIYWLPFTA